jgi:hypothetical protein
MRHITRCLNTQLAEICKQAMKVEELDTLVSGFLPESLREQCHAGSFNNSCLVLVTHDPAWASQLRFILPELRDKLRREAGIHQLASIKITVNTEKKKVEKIKSSSIPSMTDKAREGLRLLKEFTNSVGKE